MINPPLVIPNTFVNGTVIDAGQVNANFAQGVNFINNNDRFAINGNMTFYVAPGGTDAGNTGLNQSAPCATVNYVYQLLLNQYAFANAGAVVTIQLAPGTYNENIAFNGVIPGQYGHVQLFLQGDINNPAGYILSGQAPFSVQHAAQAVIQGVTLTSTQWDCLYAGSAAFMSFGRVIFGNSARAHVFAQATGIIRSHDSYTVSGNMSWHWAAQGGQVFIASGPLYAVNIGQTPIVVTLTGTPTFTYWAVANAAGLITTLGNNNVSFVNLAAGVGTKYHIYQNSTFDSFSGGAFVLPGNVAGTTDSGGIYV